MQMRILLGGLLIFATSSTDGRVAAAAGAPASVRTLTGTVDNVPFLADVPDPWNGTLLLWNHAYRQVPPPAEDCDPDHPEVKAWLLDHGYALAGSEYPDFVWSAPELIHDQLALLDWFTAEVAQPRHTVTWGRSLGGQMTAVLAERYPQRFSGALPMCGEIAGPAGFVNGLFDVGFALNTLLWPGSKVELVHIADPVANLTLAQSLLKNALNSGSPQAKARIALANALGDIPGWADSLAPLPADPDEQVLHQVLYDRFQDGTFVWGPGRGRMEQQLGGNPSWNIGIDYRRQLATSSQRGLVETEYQRAGLDLEADLATLNAAPRIAPDPAARNRLAAEGSILGLVSVPTLTLHTTGDGVAPVENERQYGDLAALFGRSGDLRQTWVARANHCFFTGAEELTALGVLFERIRTGSWSDARAANLNAAAASFGQAYRQMFSFYADGTSAVDSAFIDARPAPFLRPLP
ncbi:MAG TPA: hypothetical protein VNO21_02410 [Polyangiaceae bacterium]|nr:hypothetical protein [Polyangiaceae bacterium]